MAAGRIRKTPKPPAHKSTRRGRPAAAAASATAPSAPGASIRVLIADDHPLFLDGLEAFFSNLPDTTIIARCVDGQEALDRIRALHPDIALLDRQLPTLDAIG